MNLSDLDIVIDRKNTNSMKFDFAKEEGKPENLLPFWIADMDFPVAACITEALQKRVDHAIYGYSEAKPSYFKAVHDWFLHNFQWDTKPEWLVKTPGVVPAINLAIKALTKENEAVLIHRPVYHPFTFAIENNKRKLVNSPLILKNGRYEIDFADMERKITENKVKLAIFCSPHNPAGRVWTKEELETYADICIRHDVKIISDEIHADFAYPGYKHIPFAAINEKAAEQVILCTAPSKTFNIAGLQVSNIWIPNPEIRAAFQQELAAFGYDHVNVMGLIAGEAAYKGAGEWLAVVKEYIGNNLDYTRQFLKEKLPELKLIEPEGTYLAWIDCNGYGLSDTEMEQKLLNDAKIWVNMGSMFGPEGNCFIRLNLACPKKTLEQGLEQLYQGLENKE